MIRAGISLPALMQLMGHAQIQTTLIYVQLTSQDVYQQYARAVAQHIPAPAACVDRYGKQTSSSPTSFGAAVPACRGISDHGTRRIFGR